MIGRNTITANSMICSVMRLEVESHTVRLLRPSSEEGMMNGNIEKPAVRITPMIISEVDRNALFSKRERASSVASTPPSRPASGAATIHG